MQWRSSVKIKPLATLKYNDILLVFYFFAL
jgi:hypothetical protein